MDARKWSNEEIKDYYDSCWNLTLGQLSSMTGKTVAQLKRILMDG